LLNRCKKILQEHVEKIEEPEIGFDAVIKIITTYLPIQSDQITDLTAYTSPCGLRHIIFTAVNMPIKNVQLSSQIIKLSCEHLYGLCIIRGF